ncbi:MAG TPA: LysR family transcriptional regulator [Xanthomonadales bacterium]|nr:LysR family transcriptional regulator [Xanthomonadales bacterium]
MNIANLQDFDWNHLRFFIAVARTNSLAGAARELKVNHSTVFRRINAIEEQLGTRLFNRLPEGYKLTVAGEEVFQHARQVDEAVQTLTLKTAGKDFQLRGNIRMTTAQILASEFVSPSLKDFYDHFPGIRVEVVVSDSDYDLSRREADLALRATSAPPDFLVGRQVASLPWFAYGGLEGKQPGNINELKHYPLIGADAELKRLPAFKWLHDNFPRDQFVVTSNTLISMAAMARDGVGIAILPADQNHPKLQELFKLEPRFTTELWLLTHPELRNVERIRTFSRFLYEWIRNDPRIRPYV